MTFTVAELLAIKDLSLTLVAGGQGVDRPIRWAHVSELEDPTRFLRGGEVLLSTGLSRRVSGPERQSRFVEQLAAAKLAGLGLGLGFGFEATPPAMVEAADRAAFPLFEVRPEGNEFSLTFSDGDGRRSMPAHRAACCWPSRRTRRWRRSRAACSGARSRSDDKWGEEAASGSLNRRIPILSSASSAI